MVFCKKMSGVPLWSHNWMNCAALVEPAGQAMSKVLEVEPVLRKEAVEQHQRLGAVIAPCPRRHPDMGAPKARRRGHLDLGGRREVFRGVKFVGDPQGVAHEKPKQAACNAVLAGNDDGAHGSACVIGRR